MDQSVSNVLTTFTELEWAGKPGLLDNSASLPPKKAQVNIVDLKRVDNGSDKCKVLVTRKRTTKDHKEHSVIYIVLFSSDLNKHLTGMLVDENRNHVLTRIRKAKKGMKTKESEHNVIIIEFNCKTNKPAAQAAGADPSQ